MSGNVREATLGSYDLVFVDKGWGTKTVSVDSKDLSKVTVIWQNGFSLSINANKVTPSNVPQTGFILVKNNSGKLLWHHGVVPASVQAKLVTA